MIWLLKVLLTIFYSIFSSSFPEYSSSKVSNFLVQSSIRPFFFLKLFHESKYLQSAHQVYKNTLCLTNFSEVAHFVRRQLFLPFSLLMRFRRKMPLSCLISFTTFLTFDAFILLVSVHALACMKTHCVIPLDCTLKFVLSLHSRIAHFVLDPVWQIQLENNVMFHYSKKIQSFYLLFF